MQHIVLGGGEVGSAVSSVFACPVHDPALGLVAEGPCDVLHVCIPYSPTFVQEVSAARVALGAAFVIVHSTVKVGTTRKLGPGTAYSFVRGRHPYLEREMRLHVRHVGAVSLGEAQYAEGILRDAGFTVSLHESPEEVEFGKLYDTTYYGVCVAWVNEAALLAEEYGVDPAVLKRFDRSYNYGMRSLGWEEYVRPVLTPTPRPRGGHCIAPNAKLLYDERPTPLVECVLMDHGAL